MLTLGEGKEMTPREAVEFFANKIEQQAAVENTPITKEQKLLLRFSEVEPGAVNDPRVAEQFASDEENDAFDNRMRELLVHAYDLDQQIPANLTVWKEARDAITDHDFYIQVMVWEVFPELMPRIKIGKPSSVLDYLMYILFACALVAIVVYLALRSR